jgi:hypothetical protein
VPRSMMNLPRVRPDHRRRSDEGHDHLGGEEEEQP